MVSILPIFAIGIATVLPPSEFEKIPIKYDNQLVSVNIEVGEKRYRFVMDTGTPETTLLKENKDLMAPEGIEMKIGSHVWRGVHLGLLESSLVRDHMEKIFNGNVDGMLGMDLLRELRFGMDIKGRTLAIFDESSSLDSFLNSKKTISSAPLIANNVGTYWTPAHIGDASYLMTLDTGAQASVFGPQVVASLTSKQSLGRALVSDNDDSGSLDLYQIAGFSVAGLELSEPLRFLKSPKMELPGFVGLQFMEDLKAVWDIPHSRVYFQPNEGRRLHSTQDSKPANDVVVSPYGDVVPLQDGANFLLDRWIAPLHNKNELKSASGGGFFVQAASDGKSTAPVVEHPNVHATWRANEATFIVFEDGSVEIVHKDGTASWKYRPVRWSVVHDEPATIEMSRSYFWAPSLK